MSSHREPSIGTRPGREPWEWLAAISVIGFLLIGGMLTSLTVYATFMQRHFSWSEAAMGGGPVALLLGMSAGNLLIGKTIRHLGLRGTFSAGVGLAACGWIAAGFVQALPVFMIAMGLAGLGVGIATIVPGISLISETFHHRKGLAIALFIGACSLASSTMPMLTEAMIARMDWRATFWIVGGATGLICLALSQRLPRRLAETPAPAADAKGTTHQPELTEQQVLRMPGYWMLAATLTLSQLSMNGVLFNVVSYFEKGGYTSLEAVRVYGIANLMSLPGLMIGGYVSDRISARVMLPATLVLQGIGTAALLGSGGHASGGSLAIIVFIVIWGGVAGLPTQAGSLRLDGMIGRRAYPEMLGIIFTITGFVGALAPALMGWAYEATGGYVWPISVLALLPLLAAIACL